MLKLVAVFLIFVVIVTAGAVIYGTDRRSMFESQTAVAQANTEGIVAQAESQSQIAGYQSSADIAAVTAQLEIARLQFETTRLANLLESEKIQAMLAQTNAMIELAQTERQRMWIMLVLPSLAAIVVVVVALVMLAIVLRRPAMTPSYPMITTQSVREIVTTQPQTGVIVATLVGTKKGADRYEVRR